MMSLDRVPCRSEVMGWSPQQLADYLKTMSVPGCDKVVLKNSISGARFVNLSENDLQKFPKLHAPMISRIQTDISKNQGKRGLFGKKLTKYQEPEPNTEGGWGEDEFDEDFDDDYESPYSDDGGESGGDYESPDEDATGDYEPPPTEPTEDHKLCPSQPIGDGDYIDRRDNQMSIRGQPPAVCARPPVSTLSAPVAQMPGEPFSRRDSSPHVARRPTGKFPPEPPKVFRNNKPGRDSRSNPSPIRGPQSSTPDKPSAQSWRSQPDGSDPPNRAKPPVLPPPSSASVSRSNSSARVSPSRFDKQKEQPQDGYPKHNTFPFNKNLPPRPGIPGAPAGPTDGLLPANSLPHKPNLAEHRSSIGGLDRHSFRPPPPPTTSSSQELDFRWYVGKVTRGQAEGCLKRVNKDGAYLVRDSTRQQANQPFTLMVLYQDKVYNIQIRLQNQQYQLGTGLKSQESFPSVSDIISHYSQSTLVLIDAKNRSSSHQNQCLLSDPAGSYMKSQTWS